MLSDQTQLFSWFTEPKNQFSSRFSESGCHLVPEKKICSCQTPALVHSCARRPGSRSQRSAPKFQPKGNLNPPQSGTSCCPFNPNNGSGSLDRCRERRHSSRQPISRCRDQGPAWPEEDGPRLGRHHGDFFGSFLIYYKC